VECAVWRDAIVGEGGRGRRKVLSGVYKAQVGGQIGPQGEERCQRLY
jgi:hypothetical protein